MFIKRYERFIKEGRQSLGERVESLYDSHEQVKNIVNRFLGEIGPGVRLANAVNLLDEETQGEIAAMIDEYERNGVVEKEPVVAFSTDLEPLTESEITPGGKGAFTSFLKVMTALGQKEVTADHESCPADFLLYYPSTEIETATAKTVLGRYRSLSRFVDDVDYTQNHLRLYFGVRCDGDLEYGTATEELSPFGRFKLTGSSIKWVNGLDLKSASALKKELVNLGSKDIATLGRIKADMAGYDPGYSEATMQPTLSDRIMSFGFKGVGRWDNGVLDQGEMDNLKANFVNWVMGRRWSGSVMVSLKATSYWLYIHIKLK